MSSNYFFNISRGQVKGATTASILSFNPDVDIGNEETLWEQGGLYEYLTSDTELFMSSSSASDTNIVLMVSGMTSDYELKNQVVVFTSGQSQQSIGDFFRVFKSTVISGGSTPLGDLYIAESGALTAGVPNSTASIKSKMIQGTNITQAGLFTVPAEHTIHIVRVATHTRKNKDAVITIVFKPNGFPGFLQTTQFPNFQNSFQLLLDPPFSSGEKTDIEMRASTTTNQTEVSANIGYVLINDREI